MTQYDLLTHSFDFIFYHSVHALFYLLDYLLKLNLFPLFFGLFLLLGQNFLLFMVMMIFIVTIMIVVVVIHEDLLVSSVLTSFFDLVLFVKSLLILHDLVLDIPQLLIIAFVLLSLLLEFLLTLIVNLFELAQLFLQLLILGC